LNKIQDLKSESVDEFTANKTAFFVTVFVNSGLASGQALPCPDSAISYTTKRNIKE